MAVWDLVVSGVLALLLVAVIVASLRLDRALRYMRRDRGAFEDLVSNLATANESAAVVIRALRAEADRAVLQVGERVAEADRMATDLSFLMDAADTAGSRLEARLREAHSVRGATAAVADAPRESRIVRAARMLRAGLSVPRRAPASAVPSIPPAALPAAAVKGLAASDAPVSDPAVPPPPAPPDGPVAAAPAPASPGDPPSGPLLRAGITLRRRTNAARPADAIPPAARASA